MLSAEANANLRASGLEDDTIQSAGFEDTLAPANQGPAYKIPYFDLAGNPIDFHRVRLLGDAPFKYKQPAKTENHAYIPPFLPEGWHLDTSQPIVITEGEKKALAGAQTGLTTIGLGGVDLWRTKRFLVPVESIVARPTEKRKSVVLELTDEEARQLEESVVPELLHVSWYEREVLIAFDLPDIWTNPGVAAAAFRLSSWLQGQGAIVRLWEPDIDVSLGKIGLDDYLLAHGADDSLRNPSASGFFAPAPPNPPVWVRHMLNQRQTREIQVAVSMGVLSTLDRSGVRYRGKLAESYFFENQTKTLHTFSWDEKEKLRNKSFGRILNKLGLQGNDAGARERLADEYQNRDPIYEVDPYNAIAVTDNAVYYQLTNGRMAKVSSDGITFHDNGDEDILFTSTEMDALNEDVLDEWVAKLLHDWDGMPIRWWDTLQSTHIQAQPPYDLEQTRTLLTALFYMSPFLQRWRGLQLPIEITVAEPGSGKTFLYNLRKRIITGRAKLDQIPNEFKDWMAALGAAPGLWVGDNLGGNTDRALWNQMNETLARLVTDPDPTIDTRELYTTSDVKHIPVRCAFAFTAIGTFFNAPDVLQRSITIKMAAIPEGEIQSGWLDEQFADGREAWVAEHLVVLYKFFQKVDKEWIPSYRSSHRLRHFEQVLKLMGETLGFDMEPIITGLSTAVNEEIALDNPLIDALRDFVENVHSGDWLLEDRNGWASLSEVCEWAQEDDRHKNYGAFRSPKMLGKRIREMKQQLEKSLGIEVVERQRQLKLKMPKDKDAEA
jgi:hypothetical protein